jgi:outer membrane protein OmpA-like peptidoglycan-associated protein
MGPQSLAAGQLAKSSEKPTLEEGPGNGLLGESRPDDFRTRKIFVVESKEIFWAAGVTLSAGGREYLDTLTTLAGNLPDRLVVSEDGPGDDPELGLRRAVVVVKYLADRGIAADRCSIGAAGMRPQEEPGAERTLEVVLLDESAYK